MSVIGENMYNENYTIKVVVESNIHEASQFAGFGFQLLYANTQFGPVYYCTPVRGTPRSKVTISEFLYTTTSISALQQYLVVLKQIQNKIQSGYVFESGRVFQLTQEHISSNSIFIQPQPVLLQVRENLKLLTVEEAIDYINKLITLISL